MAEIVRINLIVQFETNIDVRDEGLIIIFKLKNASKLET